MLPADTSLEAARVQFAILRRMGSDGRVRVMFELSETLRAVLRSGIRHRHPEYTEAQVRWALLRLTLGEPLFRQACPGIEVEP
jgi:hypothetical protein